MVSSLRMWRTPVRFTATRSPPFYSRLPRAAGHVVVCGSSPWRCSAIAAHRNRVPSLLSSTVSPLLAVVLSLDAGPCAFCSAHLLASHYEDHYFVDVCNDVSSCLMELSRENSIVFRWHGSQRSLRNPLPFTLGPRLALSFQVRSLGYDKAC